jgi:hypothetical protein
VQARKKPIRHADGGVKTWVVVLIQTIIYPVYFMHEIHCRGRKY